MNNLTSVTIRSPYEKTGDGWEKKVGGLCGAVDNILRESGGDWVCSSQTGESKVESIQSYKLHMETLEHELYDSPYDEFINNQLHATMNGLYDESSLPVVESTGWKQYKDVNETLARKAVEVSEEPTTYLLNGYHLFLAPRTIRRTHPDSRIVVFVHTIVPTPEEFNKMENHESILEALSMCDRILVHTQRFKNRMRKIFSLNGIEYQGDIVVQPAPINTERLESNYSNPMKTDRTVIFSTDRMDYHKGIPLKLRAYDKFLEKNPSLVEDVMLKQKLSLGRCQSLSQHEQQYETVKDIASRINRKHGSEKLNPVEITYEKMTEEELLNHYAYADCLLVTPLSDGLNMTVFEYLVCSLYAGTDAYPIVTNTAGCTDVIKSLKDVEPDVHHIVEALDEFIKSDASYEIDENNIPKPDDLIESIN